MQVTYDLGIVKLQYEDKFFVYSPLNHVKLEVNEYAYYLIEWILELEGRIELDTLIERFAGRFQVTPEPEDILAQVNILLQANFFFTSSAEMEKVRQQIIEVYKVADTAPRTAYLLLTYRCNFDCSYCYLRDTKRDVKELQTAEWFKALELLKAQGIEKVVITGGEPLVREDIVPILQQSKNLGFHVTLLTNGSLLKDQFSTIQPLIDHTVISLDSFDPEVNAETRSGYGFEDILEVIGLFAKTAPRKIQVRAVITQNNIDEMGEYSRRINEEYGINTIRTVVNPIRLEEVEEMPELVGKLPLDHDRIASLKYQMNYRKCGACTDVLALDPAGDIFPCQTLMNPEFKTVNIFESDWFQAFLQSGVREQFKELKLDSTEVCKDCSYRYLCGGCCPAIAYNVYGALNKHVPCFCDYLKERAILSLALATPEEK